MEQQKQGVKVFRFAGPTMAAALFATVGCEQAPESDAGDGEPVELPNVVLIVAELIDRIQSWKERYEN